MPNTQIQKSLPTKALSPPKRLIISLIELFLRTRTRLRKERASRSVTNLFFSAMNNALAPLGGTTKRRRIYV